MKFSTILLFAVSATASVLDLGRQKRRRVTHDPEAAANIEAPLALEMAVQVRNANKGGSNSTSLIDSRVANSTSLEARSSSAPASNSTSSSGTEAGNATNLVA